MLASPMRVFVVDDDEDTTQALSMLLKLHGYEVRCATCGTKAVEQAPDFKPDVMLLDLAMPKFDGLAVARQLRQMPDLLGMSLVAVTGYADTLHRRQALEAGFDECLTKPLPIKQLLELLTGIAASLRPPALKAAP